MPARAFCEQSKHANKTSDISPCITQRVDFACPKPPDSCPSLQKGLQTRSRICGEYPSGVGTFLESISVCAVLDHGKVTPFVSLGVELKEKLTLPTFDLANMSGFNSGPYLRTMNPKTKNKFNTPGLHCLFTTRLPSDLLLKV